MSLGRLRLLSIVLPIAFVLLVEAGAMLVLMREIGWGYGHLVAIPVLAAGVVLFSTSIFSVLERMQQRIIRQNEELSAVNAVAGEVSGTHDLREVVTRSLGTVVEVMGARAGEIIVTPDERSGDTLRVSQGAAEDLTRLGRLVEDSSDAKIPVATADGMRIIDYEQLDDPGAEDGLRQECLTLAWIPLRAGERELGVMKLLADTDSHLSSANSGRLLAATASEIAVAIQAGHLFEDVLRRGRDAQALYEIGLKIASLQDIGETLRSVVEQAQEMLGGEASGLCLARRDGSSPMLAACCGLEGAFRQSPQPVPPLPAPPDVAPAGAAEQEAGPPCTLFSDEFQASQVSAQIRIGITVVGDLCVSSRDGQRFSDHNRDLLARLADMAAIAISNARLLEGERYLAVLEERERLSREMHDSLAQVLGHLHLKARAASRGLSEEGIARAERELNEMAALAHEAYVDVREAIMGLRQSPSPALGVIETLNEYLPKFGRQSGINVELDVNGLEKPNLSPESEVQLVRVIQEALTNVRKHAGAADARISIREHDAELSVCIEDDGQGFESALFERGAGRGFGVRIMRERIEQLGGRFHIESSPGRGTKVQVYLPIVGGNER